MCLDFNMLVILFLVFIVAPLLFIALLAFGITEVVKYRKMK